tara:strand:- start:23183 stop:24259 length:1077 start_codon:yes stop_codon:yes gene_type:complete
MTIIGFNKLGNKMKVLITGSGGLIGNEACIHWLKMGSNVVGIDNNMRKTFFGEGGDVSKNILSLSSYDNYTHCNIDIRNRDDIEDIFRKNRFDVIIHCAAQPSHDKAAQIPFLDFETNALGTLNLLESFRKNKKDDTVFIHVSTNKVYGDSPNYIEMDESDFRYDFSDPKYKNGIDESLSIDQSMHSLFGASKLSADIMAQEYGRYFDLNVGVFRGGCLTGPHHAGVELHGFLSYIVKCAMKDKNYTIFGYKGKQVRDQIHSSDVISAFDMFIENPKKGEVYNIGGQKKNSMSVLEVISHIEKVSGKSLNYKLSNLNRSGDHICYYTDMKKFKKDYPGWDIKRNIEDIINEMIFQYRS